MTNTWSQKDAIALARHVENICPKYGCHVALTGGALYKDGQRKDCDLLFYRIRQKPFIDELGLLEALVSVGFTIEKQCGWVTKARYDGKDVDLFFPERNDATAAWTDPNSRALY